MATALALAAKPPVNRWNSRTTTRRSASRRRRRKRRSSRRSASLPGSSIPTSIPATRPPRPSSRRSTRPTRCSATPTSAASTTSSARTGGCTSRPSSRAGRASPAARSDGAPGGAQDAWTINMGGPGGGYRTMSPEEMQDLFGNEDPFSDFFRTFFGGGGGRGDRRPGARRPGGAIAEGAGHRAGRRADAGRGVSRRHAPGLDQGRRPRANGRRAYSGRRQGRLARARGRRRRLRMPTADRPAISTCGCRSSRTRCSNATAPICRRRWRCRSPPRCSAAKRRCRPSPAASAEDSRGHAERPGLPPEGPRHAEHRQAGRSRRSLCDRRSAAAARVDQGTARSTTRRCRSWTRVNAS